MLLPQNKIPDKKNQRVFDIVANAIRERETAFIGITGAGGAGKSTFGINLANYFGENNSVAIDLDDYLIPRIERGRLNLTGYHPNANKLNLVREHILNLRNGENIIKPIYDHSNGTVVGEEEISSANKLFIFEGVTTLYPQIDDLFDWSIFLDALEATQIQSRIERDVNQRGYTMAEALSLYETLKPQYREFIEPTKKKASLIVEVSVDYVMYPKYI